MKRTSRQTRGLWRSYDGNNGLPGPAIDVAQDSADYLWVATYGAGICRYDGEVFRTYSEEEGLVDDRVLAIFVDAADLVWAATDRGVSCFDGKEFTTYTVKEGLADNRVRAIFQDRDGHLWFGTRSGASRFDGKEFTTFGRKEGLPGDWVSALFQDRDGHLWFGTEGGASCLTPEGLSNSKDSLTGKDFTTYTSKDGLPSDRVEGIGQDREGHLWFGTEAGVSCFDGSSFSNYTTADGLAHNEVESVFLDRQGFLWFSTLNGLSRFSPEGLSNPKDSLAGQRFENFTTADGLLNNRISTVFEDRAGDLWIGSFTGLNQYSYSLTNFTSRDGLVHEDLRAIIEDEQGGLWFATLNGLSYFSQGHFRNFTAADGLVDNRTYALALDRDGGLWIGTERGLSRWDGTAFSNYTTADGLPDNRVYSLCIDRDERLWIGTTYGGASRFDGSGFSNFAAAEGLPGTDINVIYQDRAGRLWFGSEGDGLSCYSNVKGGVDGAFTTFTKADGLPSNHITTLAEDKDGHLWVGTVGGCAYWDGETFHRFTSEDGLSNDTVMEILCDTTGYVWFATWSGIDRYDGAVIQTLNRLDGLVSGTVMAFLEDRDGHIWLGTTGGLSCYNPPPQSPSSVLIRAVVADRRYSIASAVKVSASSGLIAIEYRSINFKTRPGAMVYRYRLKGRDEEWSNTSKRRVEYQDLKPGHYTFQVTAIDRDFNYSMPAAVELEVVPDARDEMIDELERRVSLRTAELEGKNQQLEQALAQLRQTQQQLVLQEKMAALGNLVAGIVHELNSPLGAATSAVDVAQRSLGRLGGRSQSDSKEQLERFLSVLAQSNQTIAQALKRISRIVESLKSFTRLDQAEYQLADIQEGLDSTLTLLESEFKDRIEVVRDYGLVPPLHCNPGQLNQVFMSLLLNAAQGIAGQGTVTIRTFVEGGEARIQIGDTGRGISEEKVQHIFEPGFSTKGSRVGMAMGLPTSRQIITDHKGRLKLESEPGKGTLVDIVLPLPEGG